MTKHSYDVHLWHHLILRHVMVRHIIVLMCHVCGIYVFVSSCKCYSRLVNVCHGFVPSWFWYFCHSNAFHAHACHAIVCHAIVTSCKCLSCNRGHVNERPTSASSCVPRWLPVQSHGIKCIICKYGSSDIDNKDNILCLISRWNCKIMKALPWNKKLFFKIICVFGQLLFSTLMNIFKVVAFFISQLWLTPQRKLEIRRKN